MKLIFHNTFSNIIKTIINCNSVSSVRILARFYNPYIVMFPLFTIFKFLLKFINDNLLLFSKVSFKSEKFFIVFILNMVSSWENGKWTNPSALIELFHVLK